MASPFVRYGKAVKYEPEDNELWEALIKLYESTNGDNWTNNTNWCSDKPITEWYGVYKIAENNYSLDLSDNNLTGKIDQTFPNDVKITLSCNFNQLTSLNVSGCTALNKLLCVANQLTFLDASGCTALEILRCFNNELTSLNVSGCTALANLDCSSNQLTSLDVSGCMALTSLDCSNNQLISLDVSGCTALTDLWCNDNQLTSLNITGCSALSDLICDDNQLTSLNASGCTSVTYMRLADGQLTSLDVSGCTSLTHLYCHNNKIRSVIPDWFSQLSTFNHDIRFRYWTESVPDGDGGYETIDRYEDRGIGWWYPGEPGKYEHSPD